MRWRKREDGFRDWFAWYPVEIDGQYVWLEWIRRFKRYSPYWDCYFVDYMLPKPPVDTAL